MKKSIRHLAVDILDQVQKSKAFAGGLLDDQMDINNLSGTSDGRLLTHLVYGVLRFRGHLDWILAKLYRGNWEKLDQSVKNILRVGLFQLKFSDRLPAFAVVDEAVKIAKKISGNAGSLVNALLRTYLRQGQGIAFPPRDRNPADYIAAFHSHPLWLTKKWVEIFGSQAAEALCTANNDLPPLTLRANTLKISRNELQEKLTRAGFHSEATAFSPEGLTLTSAPGPVQKTGFFRAGYLRLQDEASQLISLLVCPQSGESGLDICAGTGGKTTHLAAIQKNSGRILAADYDLQKITQLNAEAARLGIKIVETTHIDLTGKLPESLIYGFNYVLVDAPCSGLGTLRRNPEIKWRIASGDLGKITRAQKTILRNASRAVRTGGRLIYCTCSLLPDENEDIIADFLSLNPDFSLSAPPATIPSRFIASGGYFQTYPHLHNMDGFFGAILVRK
jgi:16S rRNA (cytosine967-C5)-methyltransferase